MMTERKKCKMDFFVIAKAIVYSILMLVLLPMVIVIFIFTLIDDHIDLMRYIKPPVPYGKEKATRTGID